MLDRVSRGVYFLVGRRESGAGLQRGDRRSVAPLLSPVSPQILSFLAGENPEHGFQEEYGEKSFDPAQGPVVFHPPLLHEPWMAKYEHRQLEKLLADWADLSGELKVDCSRAGPEINSSREAWERGEGSTKCGGLFAGCLWTRRLVSGFGEIQQQQLRGLRTK